MTGATRLILRHSLAAIAAALALTWGVSARACCDTPDSPAASTAGSALDVANVNPDLGWVQKKDEAEIRNALWKAVAVRRAGGEAQDLAAAYSDEALVCLHRAALGALYVGLNLTGKTGVCCGCSGQANRSR